MPQAAAANGTLTVVTAAGRSVAHSAWHTVTHASIKRSAGVMQHMATGMVLTGVLGVAHGAGGAKAR